MTQKINYIIENCEKLHDDFYKNPNAFHCGPGYYFSNKALTETRIKEKCEFIYALLPAWGMHKSFGPKMKDFHKFCDSILGIGPILQGLNKTLLRDVSAVDFEKLKEAFLNIDVMESNSVIVANTKVLFHFLPNIVPPIDREHTMRFLNITVPNDREKQADLFIDTLRNFFQPLVVNIKMQEKLKDWMNESKIWDVSHPKIIDNLVFSCPSPRGEGLG